MAKIAIMYDFFSEHGGVERIMAFQARALKKEGHEVSFAFAYEDEEFAKERIEDFRTMEYAKLPFKNETLQISMQIFRPALADKFKDFDLIICHSFPASYIAMQAKRKHNIPYILHLHHPPQFLYNTNLNWAKNSFKRKFSFIAGKIFGHYLKKKDKICVKNANFYFAESKAVNRIIKKTYGIKGKVLYPTLDKHFKLMPVNPADYLLGSGRIIKQKRFDYLIEAASKLNRKIKVVLAGKEDNRTKKELEKLAREKKVELNFLGALSAEELVEAYNSARVTILTCPKEWFGLVPIEAMACGCPVVSWKDNFGPQETIKKNISGFLAKPYDVDELAKNIELALSKKWDKRAISNSVNKFREEEQAKVLVDSINKLLSFKH